MLQSKEIQEQMRKTITEIYQSGKGYGSPANHSESHYPLMAKKWNGGEPPQGWKQTKITQRVQRQFTQEVTKDPTTKPKELQASLASVTVSVHDVATRKMITMIPKTFGKVICPPLNGF